MARVRGAYSTASQGPALGRVWQCMRVMRRFTRGQLMTTAEAGETAVQKYVRALADAGYLRLVAPRVNGRPGSQDEWQLVRDSGPQPPIRRKDGNGVFDPNTHVAWDRRGHAVCADATDVAGVERALTAAWREAERATAAEGEAA